MKTYKKYDDKVRFVLISSFIFFIVVFKKGALQQESIKTCKNKKKNWI